MGHRHRAARSRPAGQGAFPRRTFGRSVSSMSPRGRHPISPPLTRRREDWHDPRRSLRPRADAGDQARRDRPYSSGALLLRRTQPTRRAPARLTSLVWNSAFGKYPAAELPGAKIVRLGVFGTVLVAAALPKGRSPTAQALLSRDLSTKQNKTAWCTKSDRCEGPRARERRHEIAGHHEGSEQAPGRGRSKIRS